MQNLPSDLRFDWYPELQSNVLDPLVDQIVDSIDQNRSTRGQSKVSLERVRSDEERTAKQLLTALYSSYFVIPKGTARVSVPKTASHYSGSSINYSYKVIIRVIGALLSLEWIEQKVGVEVGGVTRIWSVNQLSMYFDAIGMRWFPQTPKPPEELIVLRDFTNPEGKTKKERGKKIDLPVPETNEVSQYRSSLYDYNQFLCKHCIALNLNDDQLVTLAHKMAERADEEKNNKIWSTNEEQRVGYIDLSRIQLRRIFSRGSMTKGGRFYDGWWQSLPSSYRPHITIDGCNTSEVDYSSMALSIIYAMMGIQVNLQDDLYNIGLPNWEGKKDPRRNIIKQYINAVLNDESGHFRLSNADYDALGVNHHRLHSMVEDRHKTISEYFNSGIGLDAQFIDSEIAADVMNQAMLDGFVILPIHDSFIIQENVGFFLKLYMENAFYKIIRMDGHMEITTSKTSDDSSLSSDSIMRTYYTSWCNANK